MSSFSPSQTVLSNGFRSAGIWSVWPYYYSPNAFLEGEATTSEDCGTNRKFKKMPENTGFFHNHL